jgi:cell division protein FtsW (lipid II flippase)
MAMALLPSSGIPLPLISYGVSNLWVILASLGWFNGIAMRRCYINK